jgi:hypothetical protein
MHMHLAPGPIVQVHKAKLRCPRKRRSRNPFCRPVWDFMRGGYQPDIAPGR